MNIDRYKKDIDELCRKGDLLMLSMHHDEYPEQYEGKEDEVLSTNYAFRDNYQSWYSESLECISQLLPSRVSDFTDYYSKPGKRKDITYENYTISDYLQGLMVTRGYEKTKVVGTDAALPKFRQQLNLVRALKHRFESSLYDIAALVRADLFDNELDAAHELFKNGYLRPAGALCGVVIEEHLSGVASRHKINIKSSRPTISDLNDALKKNDVIDVPMWRKIQFLADIRNSCDHKKAKDPTVEDISDLIDGSRKVTKTIF